MSFLSVRDQLKGRLDDFLETFNLRDNKIHDGILKIIDRIKSYREEGKPLTPEIYLYHQKDAHVILSSIPYCSKHILGKGPIETKTFDLAVKKCAMLARDGWHIFIEISPKDISFGILRSLTPFYSVPIEALIFGDTSTSETVEHPVVMTKQLAENVVLIKGPQGKSLEVHFTTKAPISVSMKTHQANLINSISKKVTPFVRETTRSFYERVIADASTDGHGFLIAVAENKKKASEVFSDGTFLDPPISIPDKISEMGQNSSIEKYTELQACLAIISGMINSDGITLFDTKGNILGYNIFINFKNDKKATVGGARKRTFEALSNYVKNAQLVVAYYQSQDGDCDCIEVKNVKQINSSMGSKSTSSTKKRKKRKGNR